MRITAGILMIIVVWFGSLSLIGAIGAVDLFSDATSIAIGIGLFLGIFVTWSGIYAFRVKAYWWAVSGAICSVLVALTFTTTSLLKFSVLFRSGAAIVGASLPGIIVTLMGVLALIFLIKRKGEFQA